MPPAPPNRAESDRDKQNWREAVISGQVLDRLGRPDDPYSIQVRRLWEGHYRVNVLVGPSAVFAKIAHSFFVSADGEGNILTSSPAIRKLYDLAVDAPSSK